MFNNNNFSPVPPPYMGGYPQENPLFRAVIPNLTSYIRFFHASPNSPGIDIYVDNSLVAKDLKYQQFTSYLPISAGEYDIKIYPTGTTSTPILTDDNFGITPNSIQTAAIIGEGSSLELFSVPEPHLSVNPSMVFLRFVGLSPDSPSLDVALPNGQLLFKGIDYKDIMGYILIPPGNYTILLKATGTDRIVLTSPNFLIKPNRLYTTYITGLNSGNPEKQIVQALDGLSYIR